MLRGSKGLKMFFWAHKNWDVNMVMEMKMMIRWYFVICSGPIRCWWWEKRYMCMLFRPVWRLPLQGGHVHAWGDKYTHTHSLWWENIVSESTSYICYTYSIYTLYHHEILTDPGVGPALEYSSLPSIVNLSCSVRQVINTNNTMKVVA